jgi:anti-anti-sigma regulatory factor
VIREQRLDPVVHYLEVQGEPGDLAGRIQAALADGVRWLIVDLQRAQLDRSVEAPLAAARDELRERNGELILVSTAPAVADRVAAYDQASRPALAASVEQALTILKLLRPKTTVA